MKKHFQLLSALLLLTFATSAQNNHFYISLQGGPQASFSETLGYRTDVNISNATWHSGFITGYQFKNNLIQVETGLQLARYETELFYAVPVSIRDIHKELNTPEITIASKAWQIPLRLKVNLFQEQKKFNIRTVTGLKLVLLNENSLNPETKFEKMDPDEANLYTISNQNHTEKFQITDQNQRQAILALEGGLAFTYKLNNRLNIMSSMIYQFGLSNIQRYQHVHQKWEGDNSNTNLNAYQVYHSSSRAEALALSFGLSYHFSKRDKE